MFVAYFAGCKSSASVVNKSDTNIDKSISYFKKAADLDDVQSFYELGKLLLMHDKIKDGISYLDKASSHGSEDSSLILGELYESGEFVTKDYKKAFKYFKRALDQNEVSSASYDLGRFYLFGVGVEENINKAISYFKKTIPSNSYACFYLYSIYTNPRFNHVDEEKAMKYLKKGVELNDFACLLNLGTCYLDGIGVKQNYKKAFELYIKSYNTRKTSHALHNIANCYYYGYGTKKDVNMAIKYFKALKKEGYKPAIDFLNKISK